MGGWEVMGGNGWVMGGNRWWVTDKEVVGGLVQWLEEGSQLVGRQEVIQHLQVMTYFAQPQSQGQM